MARPGKITAEKLRKLEEGFLNGLSDREACCYADIAPSTLYLYCEKNPGFSERKEALKDNVKLQAKINVAERIAREKDLELSMWYLERKCRDEFAARQEVGFSAGRPFKVEIEVMDDAAADQQEAAGVHPGGG